MFGWGLGLFKSARQLTTCDWWHAYVIRKGNRTIGVPLIYIQPHIQLDGLLDVWVVDRNRHEILEGVSQVTRFQGQVDEGFCMLQNARTPMRTGPQ